MTDIEEISDPEALLDAITELADQRRRLDEVIRAQAIRAVRHLGARRYATAGAAAVSRPTLNAWLDEDAERVQID